MANLLIILIFIKFIRQSIKTHELLPQWDFVLDKMRFVAPALFVFSFLGNKHFQPTYNFLWFVLLAIIIYVLWLLKDNRIAKVLFWAVVPYVIINSFSNLMAFGAPTFHENQSSYFDLAYLGSLFWIAAFGIAANYQQKALTKEVEKNKEILVEKGELEVLVKERTAEILQQKEELEKTLEELKATQNQLIQKEKLASLGELTAGIAHEIQNPLNFVNNFSELSVDLAQELTEELDKESIDKAFVNDLMNDLIQNQQKINHHGKRASSIVKSMLEHSRTSTGEMAMTDLNKLADEYLRLSYHGMRAKDKNFNADFKTDFDENLPHLKVIPQDMGRVLLNLFNNAFYAVHQRAQLSESSQLSESYTPTISVSTTHKDGFIKIRVTDNGNGIPETIQKKIFQPFFTTKPTGEGTGLGLSLSYDIVTKGHGGTLEIETKAQEFTTFIIRLPYL